MKYILLVLLLLINPLAAANYYVATTGSDAADGSVGTPWLTIGKAALTAVAGDTVNVAAGDYPEYVACNVLGSVGSPITFISTTPLGATVKAFRLQKAYTVIDGFTITKAQNSWGSHVRIEVAASNCTVKNCHIGPGVYAVAEDMTFDDTANTVTSASSDFVTAGFQVGGLCHIGSCSWEALAHVNHGSDHTISAVTTTMLTFSTDIIAPDVTFPLTTAWAPIYAGSGNTGTEGVLFVLSGGTGAADCIIEDNTFDDLFGCPITTRGDGHIIRNNTITDCNSFWGIKPLGSNIEIYGNMWKDCTNDIINYTLTELQTIPHPAGTGWYDFYVGFIHTIDTTSVNINIHDNWFQNIENPLGTIKEDAPSLTMLMTNNVFVGVAGSLSGGREGFYITNNTFYRCGYDEEQSYALTIGGNAPATVDDMAVTGNVFVDIGSRENIATEGAYTVSSVTNSDVSGNFICGPETTGWPAKSAYASDGGVNGGDPQFVDIDDPLGPDGLPFTDDDGLRPLAGSAIASGGYGALTAHVPDTGRPVAHFTVSANSSGMTWKDATGLAFDAAWEALDPFQRLSKVRPWDTPELLGTAPVTITFDASSSIATAGVSKYKWNFGDGTYEVTTSPTIQHTYSAGGTMRVVLEVTHKYPYGHIDTMERSYRVTGAGATGIYVAKTGNDTTGTGTEGNPYLTIQKAMDVVAAGETVYIQPGEYIENPATVTAGTVGSRITVVGLGDVEIDRLRIRDPYYTFRNLKFVGPSVTFGSIVLLQLGAQGIWLQNIEIDTYFGQDEVSGIFFETGSGYFDATAPSDCIMEDCFITRLVGTAAVSMAGADNIFRRNRMYDLAECDFWRLFGNGNLIQDNWCEKNYAITSISEIRTGGSATNVANHIDCYQCFGTNGPGCKNHILERNVFKNILDGQLCQMETNLNTEVKDMTFRNNVFIDIALQASCSVPGIKYYNNTLIQANRTGSSALIWGTRAHSGADAYLGATGTSYAHNGECIGNLFYDCGDPISITKGWYSFDTTLDNITANYNYVAKSGGVAMDQNVAQIDIGAVTDDWDNFEWWEDNGINGGDPAFVSVANGDFQLSAGSVVIGNGYVNNAAFTDDFFGVSRGNSWDIGAFKYVGASNRVKTRAGRSRLLFR